MTTLRGALAGTGFLSGFLFCLAAGSITGIEVGKGTESDFRDGMVGAAIGLAVRIAFALALMHDLERRDPHG